MSEMRGISQANGINEYRYLVSVECCTAEDQKSCDVYPPYDRGLHARVAAGGRSETKGVEAVTKDFPPGRGRNRPNERSCFSRGSRL